MLAALFSEMPVDARRLKRDVERLWAQWDRDRSGFLDHNECAALFQHVSREYRAGASGRGPSPALEPSNESREAFFMYWDEDSNGTLDKEEVTRALLKTFGLAAQGTTAVTEMREILENVWPLFDPNGDGVIERSEWMMSDGLCDAVLAARQFR